MICSLYALPIDILTCCYGDLLPLPCGFPVSCLSVMTTQNEACNRLCTLSQCVQWKDYPSFLNWMWSFPVLNVSLVFHALFCIRRVGPTPELVRHREAKWINIIVQWESILLKKTNKVCAIIGTCILDRSTKKKCTRAAFYLAASEWRHCKCH